MQKTAKRIVFIDYLRAFMPILVIMIHVMDDHVWTTPAHFSSDLIGLSILHRFSRIAVPIFIMITGSLFLDPRRPFDLKKFFRKTFLKLLGLYLFWSLLYSAIYALSLEGDNKGRLLAFVENSIAGFRHLWYLKFLLAAYLVIPFLRKITENRKLLRYAVLLIIICYTLTTIGQTMDLFVTLRGSTGVLKTALNVYNSSFIAVQSYLINLFGFLIMGYYLATEKFTRRAKNTIYILGVVGFIYNVVFSIIYSNAKGDFFSIRDGAWYDITMLVFIAAVFLAVREFFAKQKSIGKIAAFMAKRSWGIYVFHMIPIMIGSSLIKLPYWSTWSMFVIIPGLTFAYYLVSLLATWIISKVPLLKKVV